MTTLPLAPVNAAAMGVVRTANPTPIPAGGCISVSATSVGALLFIPYAIPETTWQFTTVLTSTANTAMRTARPDSIRNYLTALTYQNTALTGCTITVKDGSTTIAQFAASGSMAYPGTITFPTPLRGSVATDLNISSSSGLANVLINAQGFEAL